MTFVLLCGANLLEAESIHETATRYPNDKASLYDPTPVPEYREYPPETTEAPRYPQPRYPTPKPKYPTPPKYPTTQAPKYPEPKYPEPKYPEPKYSEPKYPEPKYPEPKYPQHPPTYPIRYEQHKPEYGYVQGYKLVAVPIYAH